MVTRCGTHSLVCICYLTASTHYSPGALIPECNDLSQFKEDTAPVPVREISLIAYLPLVQPTENHPDLDLNPDCCSRQPVRPSRHCGSESALAHSATETGSVRMVLEAL